MQQTSQFFGSRGKLFHANQLVYRLGCGQLMTDRANPAKTLNQKRHFPIRTTLDKFFKAPKLDNMQARFMDVIICIQQQRNLAMSFHS